MYCCQPAPSRVPCCISKEPCCEPLPRPCCPTQICCRPPPVCCSPIYRCPNFIRGRFTGPAKIKFNVMGRRSKGRDSWSDVSESELSSSSDDDNRTVQSPPKSLEHPPAKEPRRPSTQLTIPRRHKKKKKRRSNKELSMPGMSLCIPTMPTVCTLNPFSVPIPPSMLCWQSQNVPGSAILTPGTSGYKMQAAFPPC
eukprot:Gregarina_sp_Poly_1__2538@NODE_168_length_12074_cov_98_169901_g149_i0_p7_GENE_NODE_168_length_12074_cov_98_169901_g149_i0NODE_168_length_12074_cov_98_169901_g149_i0_p7_ORF_typecomplete_len196_score9_78_NODE_168_length_12074_cov_98_169901_g149_i063986985